MILLSSRFLKREKERKYWVHPILRYREERESPLLKEQRDYHGRFKVYFRMSVAQFDGLLVILEPHIKKDHQFLWTQSARIYTVLCAASFFGYMVRCKREPIKSIRIASLYWSAFKWRCAKQQINIIQHILAFCRKYWDLTPFVGLIVDIFIRNCNSISHYFSSVIVMDYSYFFCN